MSKFLTDLSTPALAKAVAENCYAFTPFAHNWKDVETYNGKDVNWVVTDIGFPPSNSAFHTNLTPENADAAIEKFKAKGREKNVPLQWYICQDTKPANFTKILEKHGFTNHGDGTGGAGMAIDLQAMNENEPVPQGLEIIEVKDGETLKTWCHVVSAGFGIPEHAEAEIVKLFQMDIKCQQPEKYYLGVLDGKPVSSSMYFLGEGVVGIYMVATLSEARQKGAAFAVTQKALKDGRELGYRVGILQASKMGEPVYRRMGFKEVCRVSSYQWFPESLQAKEKEG
jgi:predicted GNAT family acetyltransferase